MFELIFLLASLVLPILILAFSFALQQLAAANKLNMASLLMYTTAMLSPLSVLLSGRVLQYDVLRQGSGQIEQTNAPIGKAFIVVIIMLSLCQCIAFLIKRLSIHKIDMAANPRHTPHRYVFFSYMLLFIATCILPIGLGGVFFFKWSLVYPILFYTALFVWADKSREEIARVCKVCLSMTTISSLIALICYPSLVLQSHYAGLVPQIDFRFWGLTAHANTIGSLAAALTVLEIAEPSSNRTRRLIVLVPAVTVLLLSQSKNSIAATAIAVLFIMGWRSLVVARNLPHANTKRISQITVIAFLTFGVTVAGLFLFNAGDLLFGSNKNLATAGADISTATGRSWIWQAAIAGGVEFFQFGYGPAFWSEENRLNLGLTGAVDAHNLYLQVFIQSGVVGLTALITFLLLLTYAALRTAKGTKGGSLGLLALFLIRSNFEVSIQPSAILASDLLSFLTVILYVSAKPSRKSSQQ